MASLTSKLFPWLNAREDMKRVWSRQVQPAMKPALADPTWPSKAQLHNRIRFYWKSRPPISTHMLVIFYKLPRRYAAWEKWRMHVHYVHPLGVVKDIQKLYSQPFFEVYSSVLDFEAQLNESRAWNLV